MHELLTDAEKEKMTAAGEEFYTEYFAEGENDGDFHAETGSRTSPSLALFSQQLVMTSFTLTPSLDQNLTKRTATFQTRSSRKEAARRIRTKSCVSRRRWRRSAAGPRNLRAR